MMLERANSGFDEPLRLFWWKAKDNFGDVLSKNIVSFLSGREVIWARPKEAEIFAVGSIMGHARHGSLFREERFGRPVIWGSGFMDKELPGDFAAKANVIAVRGERSAHQLGLSGLALGDPGILAAEALQVRPIRNSRIGVVPHWRMIEMFDLNSFVGDTDEIILIDPMQSSEVVATQIASCEMVLSSSLHGVIVADSFGVPNTWISPRRTHKSPRHKFWDYASSVERDLGPPIEFDDLQSFLRKPKQLRIDYRDGIGRSKRQLRDSFPDQLKSFAAMRVPAMADRIDV